MVDQQPELIQTHASSTGVVLANVDWLDIHFEACYPAYALDAALGWPPGGLSCS